MNYSGYAHVLLFFPEKNQIFSSGSSEDYLQEETWNETLVPISLKNENFVFIE